MSCQINTTGKITDLGAIRRCLFPTDDSRGSDNWLQLCKISVSPTGDLIALANERRIVILTSKWDYNNSSISEFSIGYSGSVHGIDNITAVACLPVLGQQDSKHLHVVPEWTCVLVGFESGLLRFYTENFDLLLEEQIHSETISSIKYRSQHNPRPDLAPDLHPEEIYVTYQSAVCVVAGSVVFPVLRQLRAELARAQATSATFEPSSQGSTLTPKKWGFQDQAATNDTAVVGVNLHGTFDHLLTASTCGGFDTKYLSSAPFTNLVLAAGSRPFVGYHYALEGAPQPVFSDVAKAVASKLKSALPGWLTGSKAAMEKETSTAMQPSETMGCRFGLCDLKRTALSIILSPDHKLAVVSDALGRVLLMDAYRGIVLRIFKGYREAQCSFIQAPDERHSKHRIGNKVATFLVIYSPKRGTIEIFTVQQGLKVATFSASKFSILVYNNCGIMGFSGVSKSKYICPFDTVLIDNDGVIKEIGIPFHFALNEKNYKRGRDIHLLKKLRQSLRFEDGFGDVARICSELQTDEVRLQALEALIGDKNVPADIIVECVHIFQQLDNRSSDLDILTENVNQMIRFYNFVAGDNSQTVERVEDNVTLGEEQFKSLQKFLDLSTLKPNSKELKVEFCHDDGTSPSEFLARFDLKSPQVPLKAPTDNYRVSHLIFSQFVVNTPSLDQLEVELSQIKVSTHDLFVLLIDYWLIRSLDSTSNLERELNNFYNLTLLLAKDSATIDVVVDYNSTSGFWSDIRSILCSSNRPFPALTAAIVFKQVALKFDTDLSSASDIEVYSQETIEWSLLIGKLEDVCLLNIVLSNKPIGSSKLPKLKHEEFNNVSLRYILDNGRGSISELVARWLTLCGVDCENVVINDVLYNKRQAVVSSSSSSDSGDDDDDLPIEQEIPEHKANEIDSDPVFAQLNLLKPQFPYSLDAGSILTNMCWEYALAWKKDINNLDTLEACVKCLVQIPSSHIREGLFNLVWNTHLKIMFESTCKLINKVGKLPKERLCRQDTGLTDYQITVFLGITTVFLDTYMDAVQQSVEVDKPTLQFEQIWEDSEQGPQPLVQLALNQNSINYDLLHLHYQLSLSLKMITAFAIKHSKPVNNLFESYMLGLFFVDFQTKAQINWDYADSRVQASRTQFLTKVIAASLETVSSVDGQIFTSEHVTWMLKCTDLGQLWNLDVDLLRRFELVQIYTLGYDSLGDQLFSGVQDKELLGVELLGVAGKRLSHFLSTSPSLSQNMSALSTLVTRYIATLNGDWCAPSTLEGIENVANRSLACINPTTHEYKVAEMLLDGCQTLRSIYKDT